MIHSAPPDARQAFTYIYWTPGQWVDYYDDDYQDESTGISCPNGTHIELRIVDEKVGSETFKNQRQWRCMWDKRLSGKQ